MKLLLTSSGFAPLALRAELLRLLGKSPGTFHSVFIPTAAYPDQDQDYVHSSRTELREISGSVADLDLKDQRESDVVRSLAGADLVLVNGGNTFFLLHHVRASGFSRALSDFLARGGVYVGISAGSILASPTIETAGFKGFDDPRVVELPSLDALGLVDFHLLVHDDPQWDDLVERERHALKGDLIRLRDGEAVSIDGEARSIFRRD